MQQPGNPARDNEPVSGGDAEDAGSVVSGGRSASDEALHQVLRDSPKKPTPDPRPPP